MEALIREIKHILETHEPPEVAGRAAKLLDMLVAKTDLRAFGIKDPLYFACALAYLCRYDDTLPKAAFRYGIPGKTGTLSNLVSRIRAVLGLEPKVIPGTYGHRLVRYGGDKLAWPIPRELVERWDLKPKTPVEWEITGEREIRLKFKSPFPLFEG